MTLALPALPRFAVIQSTRLNAYLRYVEDGVFGELLQFSEDEIVSPYAKFAIEGAKSTEGVKNGFVHIRCCYNNKYWVATSSPVDSIIPGADEPNEDQSQRSCTLFKPEPVHVKGGGVSSSTNTTVQFRHVQSSFLLGSEGHDVCLVVRSSSTDHDTHSYFSIINWESLVILPKHIAFKGDNSLYLSARSDGNLEFASRDKGNKEVGNEVITTKNGRVRIKNNHLGKFWKYSRAKDWDWICADADDNTTNNLDTLFFPVKLGDNTIALLNEGNKKFCMRNNQRNMENCLKAQGETIFKEVRLVVEELVISRVIYNVEFRISDARIYNKQTMVLASNIAANYTQESHTSTLKFSYKKTKSSTWNGSFSLKLGLEASVEAGIPLIAEGKVKLSTEFAGSYQWGKTTSTEEQLDSDYTVKVPPMKKVTVSLQVTQGSCDVPFSYTQCDTLMNGEQDIHKLHDGVYTGSNCFEVKFIAREENCEQGN